MFGYGILVSRVEATAIDVLLDDRDERPGVKFADMELMGIPHRFVIGDRSLKENAVEYKARKGGDAQNIALSELDAFITKNLPST